MSSTVEYPPHVTMVYGLSRYLQGGIHSEVYEAYPQKLKFIKLRVPSLGLSYRDACSGHTNDYKIS